MIREALHLLGYAMHHAGLTTSPPAASAASITYLTQRRPGASTSRPGLTGRNVSDVVKHA